MDFEAFKRLVGKIRAEHPIWFELQSDEPANGRMFAQAETRLGVQLPEEFKQFLFEYGGGYLAFANVYSLEVGSDWNLIDINNRHDGWRGDHVLISDNGAGDFYGFRAIDGACGSKVYFNDHETGDWQETRYENLFEYLKEAALMLKRDRSD